MSLFLLKINGVVAVITDPININDVIAEINHRLLNLLFFSCMRPLLQY